MRNFRNSNVGGKKKCFVAFDLPKDVAREVLRIQGELKKKGFFLGKYVEESIMSVSLGSLEEVDSQDLILIRRRLKEMAFSRFEISLSEIQVLGNVRNPQALFVELKGGGIWNLRKEIFRVLGRVMEEDLKPHLVLCRIARVHDKNKFEEELGKVCVCKKKFEVGGFILVEGQGRFSRILDEFRLG